MTIPKEKLIRDMFAAIDRREFDTLNEFFTADICYERPGYEPLHGLSELEHFYRHVRIIRDGRHEIEYVVLRSDAAACWGRFVGESHAGTELEERFADVYVLRDGRIARRTTHFFRPAI